MTRVKRYLLVLVLSFPLAFGVRYALGRMLQEDMPTAATAYVRARKENPLSEPLQKILAGATDDITLVNGAKHPWVGKRAVDFALVDDQGQTVRVAPAEDGRPIVLVFYLGYGCVHCVAQLFALEEDIALFEELGARVVAVSSDPPEQTAGLFKKHGRFHFSVLSDPDYQIAKAYGVYQDASGDQSAYRLHGTFVIGADGLIQWADLKEEPYLDNRSLLRQIARGAAISGTAAHSFHRFTHTPALIRMGPLKRMADA